MICKWIRKLFTNRRKEAERTEFLKRLREAKTANEMAALMGLRPLSGKGERLFYIFDNPGRDDEPDRDKIHEQRDD